MTVNASDPVDGASREPATDFEYLYSRASFAYQTLDPQGNVLSVNDTELEWLGYHRDEVLGKPLTDFLTPTSRQSFEALFRALREGVPVRELELSLVRRDRTILPVLVNANAVLDGAGKLLMCQCLLFDISERKHTEEALRFIAQRGWMGGAGDFIVALAHYLGKALAVDYVIIGRLCDDPDSVQTVAFYDKGDIGPNVKYRLKETPCENVMGKSLCFHMQGVQALFPADIMLADMGVESYAGIPLWDSAGRALGLIAVLHGQPLRDKASVTQLLQLVATSAAAELERKRNEERLRAREREFRALAENLPDNIVRFDREGRFRYLNPQYREQMENLTGRSSGQVLGKTPIEAFLDDQRYGYEKVLRSVIETGDAAEIELTLTDREGGLHYQLVRMVAETDDDGVIVGALAIGRDITKQKRADLELHRAHEFMTELIDAIPDPVFVKDHEHRWILVNDECCKLIGRQRGEIIGKSDYDYFPKQEADLFWAGDELAFASGGVHLAEETLTDAEGSTRHIQTKKTVITGRDGNKILVGVIRDMTEHKRIEQQLRLAASVFANSYDGILITDADGVIVDVNPAFSRITGYPKEEVIGAKPNILASGRHTPAFYAAMWQALRAEDFWQGEIMNRNKSGKLLVELLSIAAIRDDDGNLQHYIGDFTDISRLKEHEAELERIAHYDVLTGAPNRRLLADRLGQAIPRARRNGKPLAVCYLDLDGFKRINDQYGHEAGDRLLIKITQRLQAILREEDTLARMGGDEFVLLLTDLPSAQECHLVLDRALEAIGRPVLIDGVEVSVSASIGAAMSPPEGLDGDILLRHADQAMYRAKEAGKHRYCFFEPG